MAFERESREADFVFTTSVLAADTFRVLRFTGEEKLSHPFVFELELISEAHDLDLEALIESPAVFILHSQQGQREIHGVIEQAQHLRVGRHYSHYQVRLVPVHALLAHTRDLRIFQGKTTREIIDAVIKQAEIESDRLSWRLTGDYAPRDYCVQYRESDLAFISRLLEEEGIFYYFDHGKGREVMVLGDHAATYRTLPIVSSLNFRDEARATALQEEAVLELRAVAAVASGKVVLKDYRFKHPTADVSGSRSASRFQSYESYDYPGEFQDGGLGRRLAGTRLDELSVPRSTREGRATSRLLQAGFVFTLELHPREECNGQHLITELVHRGGERQALLEESGVGQVEEQTYEARFRTIPAGVTFRPPRITPRPQVVGIQSARVVGPSGQEIYPDSVGRVKIQFHWDREGKHDEKSSCWVRVSHPWAGQGFGMISIPRIGQEVLVQFFEGDPDRPVIVGRVYNGDNPVPYSLPNHKTRSTWQSRSTPDGMGSNELRFEDLKGSEEIYLHAEKDYNEVTENDHTTLVKHDETCTVDNDRTHIVHHNESITIDVDQKTQVGQNRTEQVGVNETITIGANRTEQVGANETITIGANRTEQVGANETITIGANRTEQVGANETITIGGARALTIALAEAETIGLAKALTIGGAYQVSVGGLMNTTVGGAKLEEVGGSSTSQIGADLTEECGKKMKLTAGEEIQISSGSATVTLSKSGKIALQGTEIELRAGGGLISIDRGGIITIKGPMVKINS